MEFVVAKEKDLERMCEITKMAKNQLKKMGLDQWQKGYPSREVWIQDIEDGCAYLAVEDGQILGVFAFQTTPDVSYGELSGASSEESSADIKKRVSAARDIQLERYKNDGVLFNSRLSAPLIDKYCVLDSEAKELLKAAFDSLGLSARSYHKILKVSRTIADLEDSDVITSAHLSEALQYRGSSADDIM